MGGASDSGASGGADGGVVGVSMRSWRVTGEALDANVRAVEDQAAKKGREIFVHLNHPNFGLAITAEDLAEVDAAAPLPGEPASPTFVARFARLSTEAESLPPPKHPLAVEALAEARKLLRTRPRL